MDIQKWGESAFIEYLQKVFPFRNATVGIGDDCAVISNTKDLSWLVTTDALVEGIHFLKAQIPPEDLGHKTIAVNASDIAAMGGRPKYAFLSIALPKNTDCEWIKQFIQGMKKACTSWDICLLGGDTVGSKRDLFINLTLIGEAAPSLIKYRSQAKTGDIICVSGHLGNSGAGLKILQNSDIPNSSEVSYLIHAHFHPDPHLDEGTFLASHSSVHAMMDVSDGLDCDLQRLLRNSNCGANIEASALPLSDALQIMSRKYQWDALELALTGGEDYCLLFTVSPDALEEIQRKFQKKFSRPFYPLGQITDHPGRLVYYKKGVPVDKQSKAFDHFS